MSLHNLSKSITSLLEYTELFANIKESLVDYKFLYTEGSTSQQTIRVIKIAKLYEINSNFSAEIIMTYEACLDVGKQNGEFIVCTDTLSTITIARFTDQKLIWVALVVVEL